MNKIQTFFKQIDEFFFKQIDVMLTGPSYQKVTEALSKLEDLPQKIVSQFLGLGLVFFPCIIVLVLFTSIWGAKTKVQTYKEILEEIQSAREKQTEINIVGANQISARPIMNQQALEAKLLTAVNEREKFAVSFFEQKNLGSTLKEGEAKITFKNSTMMNVSELFKALAVQENFSVTHLEIRKNTASNRLYGELTARQLARP